MKFRPIAIMLFCVTLFGCDQMPKDADDAPKDVSEAQKNVDQAQRNVDEAQKDLSKAQNDLSKAQKNLSDALSEALKDLSMAQEDVSEAQEDVSEAPKGVSEASKESGDTVLPIHKGMRSGTDAVAPSTANCFELGTATSYILKDGRARKLFQIIARAPSKRYLNETCIFRFLMLSVGLCKS